MTRNRPALERAVLIALLAGVYAIAARAGLALDAVSGFATLVWPASGLALAALLRGGFGLWPGVAAGAFAVNVWVGAPAAVALGIAAGNTLEALAGAYLLTRLGVRSACDRVRDVAALAAAALLTTPVSAGIGTACLYAADIVAPERLAVTFRAWWLGDAIGDLVIAPLLLTWAAPAARHGTCSRWEVAALSLLTLLLGLLVFHGVPLPAEADGLRQSYALFPVFIWAGLRFEQRGATLVTFSICAIAIWGTARGFGPFAQPVLHRGLVGLQTFMSIAALTALLLGAATAERGRAEREAQRHSTRVQLLADASRAYAEASHDLRRALAAVARQIGDALGATCVISLLHEDGESLETASVYDADPEAQSLLSALAEAPRPIDSLPSGVVIRTGTPLLLPHIDPASAPSSVDPEFRAYMERFAPSSLVAVPLRRRSQVFGSIVVARRPPGRGYTRDDLVLLEDLAERAALAIENARLFQRAQTAIHLRDEFLSIASHELRTPLSAVILQLEGMQRALENAGGRQPDSGLSARLAKVVHAADRLNKLVDSLLDVSRIATQRLDLHVDDCDLTEIVRDTLERVAEQARSAGCTLQLSADGRVEGRWDRLRLEQVLTNLLSNAIKYGSSKPIEVSVTATDDSAMLVVRDHGIGISESDMDRIFHRFERAVPLSHYGGLGLGLYIARQIIEAHGGSIRATSRPSAGATFAIELPRRTDARRLARPTGARGSA